MFYALEACLYVPVTGMMQEHQIDISRWCGEKTDALNLTGTLNLACNDSVFVREGLGYMLTFDKLVNTGPKSGLCFRPLEPVRVVRGKNIVMIRDILGDFHRYYFSAGCNWLVYWL